MKAVFYILILIGMFLTACNNSEGTSTGNPLVNIRSGTYSALSAMTVSEARFCFRRVRFKQAGELTNSDPTVDEDNIDFFIGEKILSTVGDNFGNVRVPPGNYVRIEFDLDNSCGNGYSVYLINGISSFTSNQHISIKFTGNITINSDLSLELALQNLINELNTVTTNSEIKTKLESISGSF